MPDPTDPPTAALAEIERLRADNERLAELLDMTQEFGRLGVWERDLHTLEGRWDRHMFRFFGFAEGATPHFEAAAQRIHPDDRLDERFRASLDRPGAYEGRYRILRDDGSVGHLHSLWRVVADAQGRPARVIGVVVDDTEARTLAVLAQSSHAQLQMALSVSGIGQWRFDLGSHRMHYDERSQAMLQRFMGPEGVALEEVRSWIHPDDVAAVQKAFEQTVAHGGPVDTRTRYRHADGRWRTLLTRRVLQRDEQGQPLAIVGVGLDVTEQDRQVAHALELAQRLDTAAEAARIGLWSTLFDGSAPEWNAYMYTLLGRDPGAPPLTLGEALRQYVHPQDRERVARQTIAVVHGSAPASIAFEMRIVRGSDGRQRWIETRGRLMIDAEGRRRAYGVMLDVTEQRDALERLRTANERATLALSSVGMGTWTYDAATGTDDWDAQMFRLRGLEPAQRAPLEAERLAFVHPDDLAMLEAATAPLLTSTAPMGYEFRIVRRDGQVRTLASRSVALLGADGRVSQRIGVNWDVTEARAAERAQREREIAQRESRTRAALFSRVSHELRTPLNAILGFTQLLRADGDGGDPARRQAWLAQIQGAGEQLLGLVDGVLELNALADDPVLPVRARVALAPVLARAAHALRGEAARCAVTLGVEDAGGVEVGADERQLGLAIGHLLRFALRRSPPGAALRVAVHADGAEVQVEVTDQGRALDAAQARNLFEPLGPGSGEGTDNDATARLGAALAQAHATRSGARVRCVRSDAGGTTLALVVPRFEAVPASAAPPGAVREVLYIEDNEVNMMIVRELLAQRADLRLHGAADGASGLARARALRPSLVLIDMQLPDIDGLEVLRRLRADPLTEALTCVALSANAMPEDIRRARAAGFDDYWTKPIDLSAFLAAIERVLPTN
ncbi:MAG TPA: PAS domain-containing protein [Burkholderiaceae bacterium]|nr:PAS domain-containing protein [Burkholderiaceae bacterium]